MHLVKIIFKIEDGQNGILWRVLKSIIDDGQWVLLAIYL